MTQRDPLASMDNDAWGRALAEAVAIALPFAPQEAEELVQNAAERVFQGQAPWNPDEKSLANHIAEVGLDAHRNRQRTERRRRRPEIMAKLVAFFRPHEPTPEESFFEKRHKAQCFEALVKDLAVDPGAQQIVRLIEQDVLGVEEQADATGKGVQDVRNARKRIWRRLKVREASEGDDGDEGKDEHIDGDGEGNEVAQS